MSFCSGAGKLHKFSPQLSITLAIVPLKHGSSINTYCTFPPVFLFITVTRQEKNKAKNVVTGFNA
jgi:hypothetical protein